MVPCQTYSFVEIILIILTSLITGRFKRDIQHNHWLIIKTSLAYYVHIPLPYISLIKQFVPYNWLHNIESWELSHARNASEIHFQGRFIFKASGEFKMKKIPLALNMVVTTGHFDNKNLLFSLNNRSNKTWNATVFLFQLFKKVKVAWNYNSRPTFDSQLS